MHLQCKFDLGDRPSSLCLSNLVFACLLYNVLQTAYLFNVLRGREHERIYFLYRRHELPKQDINIEYTSSYITEKARNGYASYHQLVKQVICHAVSMVAVSSLVFACACMLVSGDAPIPSV